MINRVGFTDNKTSFGAYFKADANGNLNKLFNHSVATAENIELAKNLRYKAPNHELEITRLSESNVTKITVRNNNTGKNAEFESISLGLALKNILNKLDSMAKNEAVFWSEKAESTKLYKLLTGQKINPDAVI